VDWNSANKPPDFDFPPWNLDIIRDQWGKPFTPTGKRHAWNVGICYTAVPISATVPLVSKVVTHWVVYIQKIGEKRK
jgi:hypothetical protein